MTDQKRASDISKKQCPNCYRLCDIKATACVACGADLAEDASILTPRSRDGRRPTEEQGFFSFLGEVVSTPWRAFARMRSGTLPIRWTANALVFYVASLIPLVVAALLQDRPGAADSATLAGADFLVVANIAQLFLIVVVVVLLSTLFSDGAAFVAVFSMMAFFFAIFNFLELVKVPLSTVPAFGGALVFSFTWLFRIWFALLLFSFVWKALDWHPALGLVFAVVIAMFHLGVAEFIDFLDQYLNSFRARYGTGPLP